MNGKDHVLIVDDEPNVRLMLRTTLESAGYAVDQAEDGTAALEQLAMRDYDLVLLDLRTPRLDGMASLRLLRDRGDRSPVVVLTAHGCVPDAVEAMKLGAIDFVSKPTTPALLRQVAARAIDRGKSDRARSAAAYAVPAAPLKDRREKIQARGESRRPYSILQNWFPSGGFTKGAGRS